MQKNYSFKTLGKKFRDARKNLKFGTSPLTQHKFSELAREYGYKISRESLQKIESGEKKVSQTLIYNAVETYKEICKRKKNIPEIKSIKDVIKKKDHKKIDKKFTNVINHEKHEVEIQNILLRKILSPQDIFDLKKDENIQEVKIKNVNLIKQLNNNNKIDLDIKSLLSNKTNNTEQEYIHNELKLGQLIEILRINDLNIYGGILEIKELALTSSKIEKRREWESDQELNIKTTKYNEKIFEPNAQIVNTKYLIFIIQNDTGYKGLRIEHHNKYNYSFLSQIKEKFNNSAFNVDNQIESEDDAQFYLEDEYDYKSGINLASIYTKEDTPEVVMKDLIKQYPEKFRDIIIEEAQWLNIGGVL